MATVHTWPTFLSSGRVKQINRQLQQSEVIAWQRIRECSGTCRRSVSSRRGRSKKLPISEVSWKLEELLEGNMESNTTKPPGRVKPNSTSKRGSTSRSRCDECLSCHWPIWPTDRPQFILNTRFYSRFLVPFISKYILLSPVLICYLCQPPREQAF